MQPIFVQAYKNQGLEKKLHNHNFLPDEKNKKRVAEKYGAQSIQRIESIEMRPEFFSPHFFVIFVVFSSCFCCCLFFSFACPVPLPPLHRLALFGLQFKFGAPNTTITCVMVVGSVSCCIDGSEI